jgi:hypothetical protein
MTAILEGPSVTSEATSESAVLTASAQSGARLRSLAWAATGGLALGVGYVPAARVPIIADDLTALFTLPAASRGSLWTAVTYGIEQGQVAGHFNPLGQALGAAYDYIAYRLSVMAGVTPQYADVLSALALIALTVAGATSLLVWGLSRAAHGRPRYWPLFALTSAITAVTLQIHAPWSNDPVISFGLAGWGSAALGFWAVAWALRATAPGSKSRAAVVVASVLAVACVEYYEMLMAAVAAVAVALVLTALTAADRAAVRGRCLLLLGTAVLLPGVLFALGRLLTAGSGTYGGTTLALGPASLRTWTFGMVGTLPGGGWSYVMGMAGPLTLSTGALVLGGALCLLTGGIGVAWSHESARLVEPAPQGQPATRGPWVVTAATIASFWALSTASHSVSDKYIREIQHPGQVYLFYSVGVVAVAALIALGLMRVRSRLRRVMAVGLLPVIGMFVLVQVALNVQLAGITRDLVPYNNLLVGLSTDGHADEQTRCDALRAWLLPPWPDYYEKWISDDLQTNYQREFGTPFCARLLTGVPRFDRPHQP